MAHTLRPRPLAKLQSTYRTARIALELANAKYRIARLALPPEPADVDSPEWAAWEEAEDQLLCESRVVETGSELFEAERALVLYFLRTHREALCRMGCADAQVVYRDIASMPSGRQRLVALALRA